MRKDTSNVLLWLCVVRREISQLLHTRPILSTQAPSRSSLDHDAALAAISLEAGGWSASRRRQISRTRTMVQKHIYFKPSRRRIDSLPPGEVVLVVEKPIIFVMSCPLR